MDDSKQAIAFAEEVNRCDRRITQAAMIPPAITGKPSSWTPLRRWIWENLRHQMRG